MNQFDKDYIQSRKHEISFESFLQSKNYLTENSSGFGLFDKWDISSTSTTGTVSKYEVKYQSRYNLDQDGKYKLIIEDAKLIDEDVMLPCGLSSTESTWYIFSFEDKPGKFYAIPTEKLKEICNDKSTLYKKTLWKNNYRLRIIDRDYIQQFFLEI